MRSVAEQSWFTQRPRLPSLAVALDLLARLAAVDPRQRPDQLLLARVLPGDGLHRVVARRLTHALYPFHRDRRECRNQRKHLKRKRLPPNSLPMTDSIVDDAASIERAHVAFVRGSCGLRVFRARRDCRAGACTCHGFNRSSGRWLPVGKAGLIAGWVRRTSSVSDPLPSVVRNHDLRPVTDISCHPVLAASTWSCCKPTVPGYASAFSMRRSGISHIKATPT